MTGPRRPDLQRAVGARVVDGFFRSAANLGALLPAAQPAQHGVERIRDLRYRPGDHRHHLLDVWRPVRPDPALLRDGKLPVVVYVHGGGFRILDKDSHWLPALVFARRGYLVFNLSYRLAPEHVFPAALEDVIAGWHWVLDHLEQWGGDPRRVGVAGESAGANLAASLVLASVAPRPEPWARTVYDRGVVPTAALPAMGLFQVSDPARFARRKPLPRWLMDRVEEVQSAYLPANEPHDLADPVCLLEGGAGFERPLPPFHLCCGTADPILDDTRRMAAALARRGVPHQVSYWPGGMHAFHMFVFRADARRLWTEILSFAHRHLAGTAEPLRPMPWVPPVP